MKHPDDCLTLDHIEAAAQGQGEPEHREMLATAREHSDFADAMAAAIWRNDASARTEFFGDGGTFKSYLRGLLSGAIRPPNRTRAP